MFWTVYYIKVLDIDNVSVLHKYCTSKTLYENIYLHNPIRLIARSLVSIKRVWSVIAIIVSGYQYRYLYLKTVIWLKWGGLIWFWNAADSVVGGTIGECKG